MRLAKADAPSGATGCKMAQGRRQDPGGRLPARQGLPAEPALALDRSVGHDAIERALGHETLTKSPSATELTDYWSPEAERVFKDIFGDLDARLGYAGE